jgi:hypothetical protein
LDPGVAQVLTQTVNTLVQPGKEIVAETQMPIPITDLVAVAPVAQELTE